MTTTSQTAVVKSFKVGDKVFDLRFGNGMVVQVHSGGSNPVGVKLEIFPNAVWYMANGNYDSFNATAMLRHGHDLIVEVKEPVSEYQVLFTHKESNYMFLSDLHYTNAEKAMDEFLHHSTSYVPTLFEPSRRLRK